MSFFSRFGWSSWSLDDITPPWGDQPSIYRHITAHLRDAPGLAPGGDTLPDDARLRERSGFGWAPGAMDGAFGHHGSPESAEETAAHVFDAFRALTDRATDPHAVELYTLLTSHSALDFVDPLLQRIVEVGGIDPERVHAVASWLATSAPDREPVKVAIALLGIVRGQNDGDVLLTLGRHEEFTLFAIVALSNRDQGGERVIFELAKNVTGWGRIHLVERLTETTNDEIRAWLLRDGYRNEIMWEYTALICARTGGLLDAVRLPDPDDALLTGAGDLLATLTASGGPAEGMESYPDGAEAAEHWARHLRSRAEIDLAQFLNVHRIRRFLDENDLDPESEGWRNWRERRAEIATHIDAILDRPDWPAKVRSQLEATDRVAFWTASEAAKALGIDAWEHFLERVRRGEDHWWSVMQTGDAARIDQAVAFAEERLPLREIASGPADTLGIGAEFAHHSALDFVLQGLGRFPGKGWTLIETGLRSPVVRNRNMALHALAAWPRESWPTGAESVMRRVVTEEPNEKTAELARRVLAGEPVTP